MTAKMQKPVEPTAEASEASIPTLRDQIAIAAMHGVLSTFRNGGMPQGGFVTIARGAYLIADEMLAARDERNSANGPQTSKR